MGDFGSDAFHLEDRTRRKIEDNVIKAVTHNMTNEINKQNSAFSKMVHEHAVGVQRVYDQMLKLAVRVAILEACEKDKEEEQEELYYCPFCDNLAELVERPVNNYCVTCVQCYAKTYNFADKEDAISAWNDRA